MAARNRYTDDDRARVFLALTVNEGNVKRTARETGVPPSTVKSWKLDWQKKGPSTEIAIKVEEQDQQFVEDAVRIRNKALVAFEKKVESGEANASQLITGVGILTDKLNARAAANAKKAEPAGSSQAEIEFAREAARALVGAISQSREREIVIEATEAEWKQADKALPKPEEAS